MKCFKILACISYDTLALWCWWICFSQKAAARVTKGLHALHLEAYSRDDNVFALVAKMVIGENESKETNEAWIQLHVCVSVLQKIPSR